MMKKAKLFIALLTLTACEEQNPPSLPDLSEVKIIDLAHTMYILMHT
jgi:hypothetical protein